MRQNDPDEHEEHEGQDQGPVGSLPDPDSEALRTQLEELRKRARRFPSHQQQLLEEALEQLSAALEELQVAEADLRQQNEELSTTQVLLDAERRRYHELFALAPDAYVVTDPDGIIEELNRAAASMFGGGQRSLIGRPLSTCVDPAERREFRLRLASLATTPRIEDWLLRLTRASGESLHVAATVEAVRESDQRLATLRWLLRDATERVSMEQELSFRRSLLEAQSESSIDGILVVDASGAIVSFNRRFVEMWNIPEDVMATRSDQMALASVIDQLPTPDSFLDRVAYLYAHPDEESRDELVLKDGQVFDRYSAPVKGAEGTSLGRVWFFRDVTRARHREREREELLVQAERARAEAEAASTRLRSLHTVTDVMLRQAGVEELLDGLLEAVREALGTDTATILLPTPDGKNLAVRAVKGEDHDVIGEIRVPIGMGIAGRIASERRPKIVDDVPAAGPYSEALRSRAKSLVGVPMILDGRVIGVVHTATFSPRRFTQEDQQLLELVAERAAVAIKSAELYDAERQARSLADRSASRSEALRSITAAMSEAMTTDQVAKVIVERGVAAFDAVAGLMALVTEEGRSLEIVRAQGYPEELIERWKRFPVDASLPLSEAVSTGRPVLLESVAVRQERYPHLIAALDLPDHAVAAVPMSTEGRPIGGLAFRFSEPRTFDQGDVEFIMSVAGQAALALERARLFEAEREARRFAELAQLRLAFLAEAGAILSGSLQIPDALESLARLAVTFLGDLCLIDLRLDDGSIGRVAVAHADPEKQSLADLLRTRYGPDPSGPHPAARVMETGQSEFAAEMPEEFLRQTTRNEEHLGIVRALGFQSFMCVPLITRSGVRGCFTLVSCDPYRRFGKTDVALAEELARRAALAMDNAGLYEDAVVARREAERAAERTATLQTVTAALAEALTPAEVAEVLVERGLTELSASAGAIALLSPDGRDLTLLRAFGYPEETLDPWRRFSIDSPAPVAESTRTGKPIFVASVEEAERRFPGMLGRPPTTNGAWAAIPLAVEGRTIGAIGLAFPEARDFSEDERAFMLALGRQCAQALERARLYGAERAARAEAEQAEDRLLFLAEASEVLASSLDIEITLSSIARLAVPRLADWCTIDLLDEDGSLRQVAVSHRDQSKEAMVRELRERYPPEREPVHAIWRVLLSGESELAPKISDRDLVARAKDPLHIKMLRLLGIRSHMVVPLEARGKMLGTISFVCGESGRTYGRDDLILAEDLGRRAAVAIDNSGLYQAELAARRESERAGERLTFLSEATASLSAAVPDYEAMLERVAGLAVPVLADVCVIDVLADDGSIRRVAATHADQEKQGPVETLKRYPPDPMGPHPALAVLATGEPLIVPDLSAELRASMARDNEHLAAMEGLAVSSMMIFPLRARERTLGAMTLMGTGSRRYAEDDTLLAEELARRAALVVDNARLYDLQRNIAQTLQRSLLPSSLPDIPGMELAARYRAAGEGNEVGGDFYDAYEVSDGAWILTIGDVCGKGPEAAAVTGLARHTLRAIAFHEPRPSRMLSALNDAILRELGDDRFCTVCCIRLRLRASGARITMCSGGHPLPLVLRADGTLETVGRPSMLLGILPEVALADHALDLGPGDAIVLFTDGVVEEMRGAAEPGPERLSRVLSESAGGDAATIAETIERSVVEYGPESPRDDFAVLVLRVLPG